jgi:hypothetical protein
MSLQVHKGTVIKVWITVSHGVFEVDWVVFSTDYIKRNRIANSNTKYWIHYFSVCYISAKNLRARGGSEVNSRDELAITAFSFFDGW